MFHWFEQLHYFGLSIIKNAPKTKKTLEELMEEHAHTYIRPTMYGKVFDVINVPDPINIAYSALPLAPHCDLNYYEVPPGIQLLHCLKTTVVGGSNYFVDGFMVFSFSICFF